MKTVLRIFAALVLLILLLVILSAVGLHLYLKTGRGGELVLGTVNSLIPGRIQAEDVSVSLLGQSVSFTEAALLGPRGDVVLTSGGVRLEIDIFSLLNNRLVFNVISLKGPDIRLIATGKGQQLNLVQAFVEESPVQEPKEKEETGEGPTVIIENLAIEDGLLQYTDESAGTFVRLEDMDAQASLDLSDIAMGIAGSAAQASLIMGGRTLEFAGMKIEGEYERESLDILFAEVIHEGFRVSARGEASDVLTKPRVDMVLEYGGELSGLMSLLEPDRRYSGRVSGRVGVRGALENPQAEAVVEYEDGEIAGIRIDGLRVEMSLEDRIVELGESVLQIASGTAAISGKIDLREVFPQGFIESEPDLDAVSYDLVSTLTNLDPGRFLTDAVAYPDSVSGRVEIAGRGVLPPNIAASSDFVLHLKGNLPEFPATMSEIDIRGKAGLDYPLLTYTVTGGLLRAVDADIQGRMNLDTDAIQAAVNLDVRRVEDIAEALDMQAKGSLSVRADISGTLGNPVASGTLMGKGLQWQDFQVGDLSADLGLEADGMLNLTGLSMNTAGKSLAVQGGVRVFRDGLTPDPEMPVKLDIRLDSARVDQMIVQEGMGGTLDGDVHVSGRLTGPSVRVDLRGEGVIFQGVNLGNIRIRGDLTAEGVTTTPVPSAPGDTTHGQQHASTALQPRSGETATTAVRPVSGEAGRTPLPAGGRKEQAKAGSGTGETFPVRRAQFNPGLDFEITGEQIDLQGFTPLAEGMLRYDARITGSLKEPRGTFQVSGAGITLAGQEIEEVRAWGDIRGRQVLIRSLAAQVAESQTVTGSGSLNLSEPREYEVSLSTQGIMLGSLAAFRESQVTGGMLVFDIAGSGTLENPGLQGTLQIVNPAVRGQILNDIVINLTLEEQVVKVAGRSDFSFDGTYHLQTQVIDLEALFEEAELAPYLAIAGRPELRGVVSGSMEITGDVSDMADLEVSLHVDRAYIGLRERVLLSARSLTAEYRQGSLVIPETSIDLPGEGSMLIRADAAPKGELNVHAGGMIPLEIMELFDPELADLTGMARFEVDAAGRFQSPRVKGDVFLENVEYSIPYNNQLVHEVRGHVQISRERILVEDLAGRLDSGYFEIRGRVDLEDLKPGRMNMTARMRSLPLVIPDTADLLLEGEASLTGMPDKSLLQANVTILEALYYKDLQLNLVAEVGQRILGGGREVQAGREPIGLPYMRNAELDITIVRRGPVLIENNLAELTLSPDLNVRGTLNTPVVTGRVSVIEGTVTYQRRTFEVTQGVVEFIDPYRTRAVVDLEAEGEIRDWMIFLSVSGPLDNLNIELASDPPAEDAVILTLLATGKTPDELTGVGGAPRSPSSMLAELLASTYGEELRETTGLDILELETVSPEGGTADNIRITVGEELTRRLTVKYSLETTGSDMTRTAIAEYKLLESLMFNGFQDSKGVFGADFRFRVEFR